MPASIENLAKEEVHSMIGFLHAKSESPADIHHHIVSEYWKIMNRRNISKWCWTFSQGRTDVHEQHKTGKPSVTSDARLRGMEEEAIRGNRRLTMREFLNITPEEFMTTLYELKLKVEMCLENRR